MSDKEEKARSMSETIEKKGFAVSQYILNTSLKANKKMSELGEKAKEKGWMQPKDKPAKISKKNQQRMDKAEKYVDIAVGGTRFILSTTLKGCQAVAAKTSAKMKQLDKSDHDEPDNPNVEAAKIVLSSSVSACLTVIRALYEAKYNVENGMIDTSLDLVDYKYGAEAKEFAGQGFDTASKATEVINTSSGFAVLNVNQLAVGLATMSAEVALDSGDTFFSMEDWMAESVITEGYVYYKKVLVNRVEWKQVFIQVRGECIGVFPNEAAARKAQRVFDRSTTKSCDSDATMKAGDDNNAVAAAAAAAAASETQKDEKKESERAKVERQSKNEKMKKQFEIDLFLQADDLTYAWIPKTPTWTPDGNNADSNNDSSNSTSAAGDVLMPVVDANGDDVDSSLYAHPKARHVSSAENIDRIPMAIGKMQQTTEVTLSKGMSEANAMKEKTMNIAGKTLNKTKDSIGTTYKNIEERLSQEVKDLKLKVHDKLGTPSASSSDRNSTSTSTVSSLFSSSSASLSKVSSSFTSRASVLSSKVKMPSFSAPKFSSPFSSNATKTSDANGNNSNSIGGRSSSSSSSSGSSAASHSSSPSSSTPAAPSPSLGVPAFNFAFCLRNKDKVDYLFAAPTRAFRKEVCNSVHTLMKNCALARVMDSLDHMKSVDVKNEDDVRDAIKGEAASV